MANVYWLKFVLVLYTYIYIYALLKISLYHAIYSEQNGKQEAGIVAYDFHHVLSYFCRFLTN